MTRQARNLYPVWLALALTALLAGCAGPAANYAPSIDNVETLKGAGSGALKTGTFAPAPGLKTGASIQLRANTMVSATGSNFGDYIASALRQELELAKLYDPMSLTEVSGALLENEINAGGMATNDGAVAVHFVVRRADQVRYDKVQRVTRQWESSFAGAVAIPLAANNYPLMVQQLIGKLIADPDFIRAVRP